MQAAPQYAPPPGFTRLRLVVAWDGAGFVGWQSQPNAPSVQDTLQAALLKLGQGHTQLPDTQPPDIQPPDTQLSDIQPTAFRPVAAGRTDAGVHAEAMTLHWDVPAAFRLPPQRLARALNAVLPPSVAVLEAGLAPANFHARFSCTGRRYVYRLLTTPQRHPLWAGRALHIPWQLDSEAMNAAAALLVGTHDFAAFATQEDRQTVRELRLLRVETGRPLTEITEIQVEGESFLRHMVRGLVGTLLLVGQGKLAPQAVRGILASRTRAQAGANVAACGLYFAGATYPLALDAGSLSHPLPYSLPHPLSRQLSGDVP